MEQTQNSSAKRQTAIKIWLNDILNSKYIKAQGEWDPNYILTPYDTKVSRVNIMGIIVSDDSTESNTTITIDDGSGRISLRSFEKIPQEFSLGQIVLVIGRPREFSNEIYVMPEIIKVLNNKNWIELRKLELEQQYGKLLKENLKEEPVKMTKEEVVEEVLEKQKPTEEIVVENSPVEKEEAPSKENLAYEELMDEIEKEKSAEQSAEEPSEKPFDKIMNTIRKVDTGDGADIDEVIAESGIEEKKAEGIINNLLMDGEAFEIKPGKLKLLD